MLLLLLLQERGAYTVYREHGQNSDPTTPAHALGLRCVETDAGDLMTPGLILLWPPKGKAEAAALGQKPQRFGIR